MKKLWVAVVALAAAGCGPGAGDAGGPVPTVSINRVDRAGVKDGGTLRWPLESLPVQWNFHHLDGAYGPTSEVISSFMPNLWRYGDAAEPSVNRDYLTGAKITDTAPDQVVTYKINPKARWSDGTPITWRDFAAQWRALNDENGEYRIAASNGYERIGSVRRGSDEREVVVTYDDPYADWQSLFDPLYPASTNSDPAIFNKGWRGAVPTTAGPFKVGEIDQGAKTITVVRDGEWWGDPAKLDKIVFRSIVDTSATANAFANGEIDLFQVGPEPAAYQRARDVPGADIRKAAGPDYRHITFSGTSPRLRDVRVRRAVAMGISREAIAKADLKDLEWPVQNMGNHFFVNTQDGYEDNSGNVGRYDQRAAGRLLDDAGWRRAGDYRHRNGETLSLRMVVPSGTPVSKQEAELVQSMLQEIGVKVEIQSVPGADFFTKYVNPGNFDLAPFSWLGTPFPVTSARSKFARVKGDDVQQNYGRIGSERIDELLEDAGAELDQVRSRRLADRADELIWDQVHSLVLYQRPQIYAVKSTLANIGAFGFVTPTYQDIGFTR